MKSLFALLVVTAALIIIGCGGGGGDGGTGVTGVTNGTNANGGNTGINTGIVGRVRDTAGLGVQGATVRFYNDAGTMVRAVTTNAQGNFAAELPVGARRFTVDVSTSPNATNYFNQFSYANKEYLGNEIRCLATGPNFSQGQAVSLSSEVVVTLRWMGPPPPPNGCLQG